LGLYWERQISILKNKIADEDIHKRADSAYPQALLHIKRRWRMAMQEWIPSITDYFSVMETLSLIQKKHRERETLVWNKFLYPPTYELLQCPDGYF